MWMEGFIIAVSGYNIFYLIFGTLLGLTIGALPGLGSLFGISLMLPLTFGMDTATALIFLSAIHASCTYGGSIAAILVNAPGSVGSVATCWDGFPMAQQGRAGEALGISATSSLLGGILGWLSLVFITPLLVMVALMMGPAEYFMVAIVALSLLAMAAYDKLLAGLALGGTGLMLSFIGDDPITADYRFTLGTEYLIDGIPLVCVAVGLFALSQALVLGEREGTIAEIRSIGKIRDGLLATFRHWGTIVRSAIVGVFLGVMPALGVSSASLIAYLVEKRASKNPETFGTGNPAGIVAPELANNCCIVSDLIPTLALGIPGSAVTALFIAALTLHGLNPGVQFYKDSGALPYAVQAGILLAQFSFFGIGLLLARFFARLVLIPKSLLVPIIVFLCFVGSFAIRSRVEDILVTIIFGFLGYFFHKKKYPTICLVLGLVLGNITEANFHRAFIIGRGSYSIFFKSNISMILFGMTALSLTGPSLVKLFKNFGGFFKRKFK